MKLATVRGVLGSVRLPIKTVLAVQHLLALRHRSRASLLPLLVTAHARRQAGDRRSAHSNLDARADGLCPHFPPLRPLPPVDCVCLRTVLIHTVSTLI